MTLISLLVAFCYFAVLPILAVAVSLGALTLAVKIIFVIATHLNGFFGATNNAGLINRIRTGPAATGAFGRLIFKCFGAAGACFGFFLLWQKALLQIVDRGTHHIGFIFIFTAFRRITFGLRVHPFWLPNIWHKTVLLSVCFYTFVFFNPQANISSANTVYCPDGHVYQLESGYYIRCEDFDEFHLEQANGNVRTDLYLKRGSQ